MLQRRSLTVMLLRMSMMTERSPRRGQRGGGGAGGAAECLDAFNGLINHCNLISKPKRTDRSRGRVGAAFDSNWGAFGPDQDRF